MLGLRTTSSGTLRCGPAAAAVDTSATKSTAAAGKGWGQQRGEIQAMLRYCMLRLAYKHASFVAMVISSQWANGLTRVCMMHVWAEYFNLLSGHNRGDCAPLHARPPTSRQCLYCKQMLTTMALRGIGRRPSARAGSSVQVML